MPINALISTAANFVISNFTLILLSILTFISLRNKFGSKSSKLPPGPRGLPLLGNILLLRNRPELEFHELGKKYGDIFSFRIGRRNVVVLNSYDAIKEAFVKDPDVFAGRTKAFFTINYVNDSRGFALESGLPWQVHRRFTITTLRDFGMGKQNLHAEIEKEAASLANEIQKYNGEPVCIEGHLKHSTSNIICSIAFGQRFPYKDSAVDKILSFLATSNGFRLRTPANAFPFTRYLLPDFLNGMKPLKLFKIDRDTFLDKFIKDHIETYDENNIRDFIDAFLKVMKDNNLPKEEQDTFEMLRLRSNIFALFIAGTTTTAMTISWALKLLLVYPAVQEKLHEEIDRVVGTGRAPNYADKNRMPYTEAFIMEVQRFADHVPLGVPHSTTETTTLRNFVIPKDTLILSNLHEVLYSKDLWGDPENFRPERFLTPNGNVTKPEYFIPFSIGKRICLGETLARTELFLFLVTLLQNFKFQPPNGIEPEIELAPRTQTKDVKAYLLRAIKRV